jgi:two-component system response regulator FixJ
VAESVGTIAIVDDDDGIRRFAANLLQRRGFAVRTYSSGNEFLALDLLEDLNCVLLDMHMPGMNALEVMRGLKTRSHARVVVLTGHSDINLAVEAMKLGASDFLIKPCSGRVLVDAVRNASEARTISGAPVDPEAEAKLSKLTRRQRDVLHGILKGQPNKIIAWELGLSVRTVEAHRSNLLERLGAHGTAELVRTALAGGTRAGAVTRSPDGGRQPSSVRKAGKSSAAPAYRPDHNTCNP